MGGRGEEGQSDDDGDTEPRLNTRVGVRRMIEECGEEMACGSPSPALNMVMPL